MHRRRVVARSTALRGRRGEEADRAALRLRSRRGPPIPLSPHHDQPHGLGPHDEQIAVGRDDRGRVVRRDDLGDTRDQRTDGGSRSGSQQHHQLTTPGCPQPPCRGARARRALRDQPRHARAHDPEHRRVLPGLRGDFRRRVERREGIEPGCPRPDGVDADVGDPGRADEERGRRPGPALRLHLWISSSSRHLRNRAREHAGRVPRSRPRAPCEPS